MKRVLILGAGTAGTIVAQHLKKRIDPSEWSITIVDEHATHYYQPGFLFIPFGSYPPERVKKPKTDFIPKGVEFIQKRVEVIEPEKNAVTLADGDELAYDILVIATGARIAPEETEGLMGDHWRDTVFDFYTIEGATALRDKLSTWEGGHLALHLTEMPIKCPVAPLEFIFLADDFFRRKKMRDRVKLTLVTPLSGAFTKPKTTETLAPILAEKDIAVVPDFDVESIDGAARRISSYGGQTVDYDLLVSIPTNMGDPLMERSGLGDDLNYVPANNHTLQAEVKENIFVLGDAAAVPASKAGSVAHFQAEVVVENIGRFIEGKPLAEDFDGHAICFIESGAGKAFLIDFNYDVEPLLGSFPIPGLGPFKLLKQTWLNHVGKYAFEPMYWHLLLKGRPAPFITNQMSLRGKKTD